jgi:hypothetical protein
MPGRWLSSPLLATLVVMGNGEVSARPAATGEQHRTPASRRVRGPSIREPLDNLRTALANADQARDALRRASDQEMVSLAALRGTGLSWWKIATLLVPVGQRRGLARVLRQRYSQRRRVARDDTKMPAAVANGGTAPGSSVPGRASSTSKEVHMPTAERVLKRTTVTEEFLHADEADDDDDLDGDDPGEEEELDESDLKPKGKAKARRAKG